ncbi:MAG: hypothetical protein GF331_01230 [Chitinivibrionales bacterium]|nr:hypothetical protein [Chitinivibrionales bacterium]
MVCRGRDSNGALGAIVYDIATQEWTNVALSNYSATGLWIGPLSGTGPAGPVIALSDTTSQLSEANPRDTVTVTNGGTGTLTDVTITEDAAWLTVNRSGSGSIQELELVADPAGLAAGTYAANVAVSGGGASNSAVIEVTFDVAVQLTAPNNLAATVDASDNVVLQWNDRSDAESGFAVERADNGEGFAEIGRVGADVTSYTDNAPGTGTYEYRVRAYDATSYSGYSETAQASIAAASSITITAPGGGETLTAGETFDITWTAVNITAVVISFSSNDGETWTTIHSGGAIFDNDPEWGSYPWTVPAQTTATGRIKIVDYNQGPAVDETDVFTINVSSAVLARAEPARPGISRVRRTDRGLAVSVATEHPGTVTAVLTALDGAIVDRVESSVSAGTHTLELADGAARGMRVLRVYAGPETFTRLLVPHGR